MFPSGNPRCADEVAAVLFLTDFILSLCPGSRVSEESVNIPCVQKGSAVTLCGTQHACRELFELGRSLLPCFTIWGLLCACSVGNLTCPNPPQSTVLRDCLSGDGLALGFAFGLCSVEGLWGFPLGQALRIWGKWLFWVETPVTNSVKDPAGFQFSVFSEVTLGQSPLLMWKAASTAGQ